MELIALVLWFPCAAMYVYWIAQPLFALPKTTPFVTRFSLADLFWLFFMLQYPLALVVFASKSPAFRHAPVYPVVGGLILLGVVVFLWWRCTGWLSQLGVTTVVRRGVFFVVVMPIAVLGALVGVPAAISFEPSVGPLGLVACFISGLFGHCLTRWVAARVPQAGA